MRMNLIITICIMVETIILQIVIQFRESINLVCNLIMINAIVNLDYHHERDREQKKTISFQFNSWMNG